MAERTRTCPNCGGTMLVRLGEFQCQQCETTLPLAAAEESQTSSGYGSSGYSAPSYGQSGGGAGLRARERMAGTESGPTRSSPYDPGAQYRSAPTVAPPAPAIATAPSVYGVEPVREFDPLAVEKKIFFAVLAIGYGIEFLMFAAFGIMMMVAGEAGSGLIFMLLIGAVFGIVLWLYYIAIFGSSSVAKWGCLILNSLHLVWLVAIIFSGYIGKALGQLQAHLATMPEMQGLTAQHFQSFTSVVGFFVIFMYIFAALWVGWLVAILYRDIQRQRAYG